MTLYSEFPVKYKYCYNLQFSDVKIYAVIELSKNDREKADRLVQEKAITFNREIVKCEFELSYRYSKC